MVFPEQTFMIKGFDWCLAGPKIFQWVLKNVGLITYKKVIASLRKLKKDTKIIEIRDVKYEIGPHEPWNNEHEKLDKEYLQ